jgi:hypothetical protein
MDGPESQDQFVENSIVLRWLKDVKAIPPQKKGYGHETSGLGIRLVSIESSATMKPLECRFLNLCRGHSTAKTNSSWR